MKLLTENSNPLCHKRYADFYVGFKSLPLRQKEKSRNRNGFGVFLVIPTVCGIIKTIKIYLVY